MIIIPRKRIIVDLTDEFPLYNELVSKGKVLSPFPDFVRTAFYDKIDSLRSAK